MLMILPPLTKAPLLATAKIMTSRINTSQMAFDLRSCFELSTSGNLLLIL